MVVLFRADEGAASKKAESRCWRGAGCSSWPSHLPLQEHRGLLAIRYPMEHGVVRDWNDMERIWQYVYSKDQLQTFSEEVWQPPPPSARLPVLRGALSLLFPSCLCSCTSSAFC